MIIREIEERVEPSRPFSSIDSVDTLLLNEILRWGLVILKLKTKVPPLLNQEVE
jgi:hypothetical protein